MSDVFIHESAVVDKGAKIGKGSKVWCHAQIREGAIIGERCTISKSAYIDFSVVIGNNVKVQNRSSIYYKAILEDGVFVGPHVVFANDKTPRAINPDGTLKKADDWNRAETVVKRGASIGAGSVIIPGITIGEYAMVGAGSVVTRDVPAHTLVYGCLLYTSPSPRD